MRESIVALRNLGSHLNLQRPRRGLRACVISPRIECRISSAVTQAEAA
jgi:hypothetical protein